MIKTTIVCLGKLKEKYLIEAQAEYEKRLKNVSHLNIIEIEPERLGEKPNEAEIKKALDSEAKKILSKIPGGAYKIALCIEGKQFDSVRFAQLLSRTATNGFGNVCFIIGSSYGLSDEIKSAADYQLSMSEMTFPHQLARIMLLEQIYRAYKINNGGTYHK